MPLPNIIRGNSRHAVRIFRLRYIAVVLLAAGTAGPTLAAEQAVAAKVEPLPLEQLQVFAQVFSQIKENYVTEVDDKQLLANAIRGMLEGLDPHSAYLDFEEFRDLRISTSGRFGGLGLEVQMQDGFVKVIAPIDGTPAAEADIQPGDLIIKLGDTPIKGLSLGDAVKKMRGKPGTSIVLTILREGQAEPLLITLERAVIKVKSVRSELLNGGLAYLRISQFQAETGPNLAEAIDRLKLQNNGKLNGAVLDLRNNPGGVLNAAVEVSDLFLDDGLIVYTEGRNNNTRQDFSAEKGDALDGQPLVVLVNAGSASASEIVAGALQDARRAIIMGQQTFGKGSVQTISGLENGDGVKMTTARYYTPKGRSIQAEGIVPGIELDKVTVEAAKQRQNSQIKEADLSGRLDNPNAKPEGDGVAEIKGGRVISASVDYELFEAVNLLKALTLVKK